MSLVCVYVKLILHFSSIYLSFVLYVLVNPMYRIFCPLIHFSNLYITDTYMHTNTGFHYTNTQIMSANSTILLPWKYSWVTSRLTLIEPLLWWMRFERKRRTMSKIRLCSRQKTHRAPPCDETLGGTDYQIEVWLKEAFVNSVQLAGKVSSGEKL